MLDNYSVHTSEAVNQEQVTLEKANVRLFYLPSYSPELSAIEPIWQTLKHHEMQTRDYSDLATMKSAVETALERKAQTLKDRNVETRTYCARPLSAEFIPAALWQVNSLTLRAASFLGVANPRQKKRVPFRRDAKTQFLHHFCLYLPKRTKIYEKERLMRLEDVLFCCREFSTPGTGNGIYSPF